MVPVTTKPFLNSLFFIIFQQGFPAFFFIKIICWQFDACGSRKQGHAAFSFWVSFDSPIPMCFTWHAPGSIFGIGFS
ncbi:hypothetical protein ER57_09445 [Smithella sp. SCADC]|jgi:hypothetical protein|nr:hypothetical protein ER57_09445 [Smithella sp. SCADC]